MLKGFTNLVILGLLFITSCFSTSLCDAKQVEGLFTQEVTNLRADVVPGKVTLKWNLKDTQDVAKIQIYRNEDANNLQNYDWTDYKDIKIAELLENTNEFIIINHPPLIEFDLYYKTCIKEWKGKQG